MSDYSAAGQEQYYLRFKGHVIQKHLDCNRHLTLGSKEGNRVARAGLVGKANQAARLVLNIVDKDALFSQKSAVVAPGNRDCLNEVVFVLHIYKLHD